MKIILYSNRCPCCDVLKTRLDEAGIDYMINSNTEDMLMQGITYLPMLSVDGEMMNYPAALAWLSERMNPDAN
ncbi:MAG: hypothetical protein J6J78_11640 [Clostridia bacterium]|nr:hypothetical protein [Clostridia bacterium]